MFTSRPLKIIFNLIRPHKMGLTIILVLYYNYQFVLSIACEGMLMSSRRGCGQVTPTGGEGGETTWTIVFSVEKSSCRVLICPRIAVWYTASTGWERRKD